MHIYLHLHLRLSIMMIIINLPVKLKTLSLISYSYQCWRSKIVFVLVSKLVIQVLLLRVSCTSYLNMISFILLYYGFEVTELCFMNAPSKLTRVVACMHVSRHISRSIFFVEIWWCCSMIHVSFHNWLIVSHITFCNCIYTWIRP